MDNNNGSWPLWRRRLITWGMAAVALGLGFLIPYTLYLNQQVTQRFGELRWQVPTRVYARPLVLAPGVAMDAANLKTELAAASYRDDGVGKAPATYAVNGSRFVISSRGYVDVDGRVAPRRVEVNLSGGRVASLRDADSHAALKAARLDPARIATLYGQRQEERLGERLWLAPSCSLLHSPVDLEREDRLDEEVKSWLAFAVQKCSEVATLARAIDDPQDAEVQAALARSRAVQAARAQSPRIHKPAVQARLAAIEAKDSRRTSVFATRIELQRARLQLPAFPTTTIGSFPQTPAIRLARQAYKQGRLSLGDYTEAMQAEIRHAVAVQEQIGLDVLVHGEAERNDMVEYFAEQLEGYVFTRFGWVQSYGSRCVKPAIIYGDLSRPRPMTVDWIRYAQQQTDRIMKGMLTGPVTMLMWSFAREDVPREVQARQLALAIRDEVCDLEAAGIRIIQIDEAAFREGLPLRREQWRHYLDWAVEAFRLCASGVRDETQIHTHMCYSEFNDVIESIAAMDADVITIETSRSQMELLEAFRAFDYPNDIGPGVYDIHSPRVPDTAEMVQLLEKAAECIPAERLWVNPDCGLKTRGWPETEAALVNMVAAARQLRAARSAKVA